MLNLKKFTQIAICLLALSFAACRSGFKSESPKTQVLLVRHAEKAKGKNPGLTEKGKKRAQKLIQVSKDYDIVAVFSSPYRRTKETAQPLADHLGLEVNTSLHPMDYKGLKEAIESNYSGKVVLVVGHSNTVPGFINHIIPSTEMPFIDEGDFSNLFLLEGLGDEAHLVKSRYEPDMKKQTNQ